MNWIRRKVQVGVQEGRKIGFPTLNFKVGDFGHTYSAGVYGCELEIRGKTHKGALYFGPRLGTRNMALEIYVLDFDQDVYGEIVRFRILGKIRNAMSFGKITEIKSQIEQDLQSIVAG